MAKTKTTRYDVAEHLRTPEEMAAYLEACLEEADGDAAFIARSLALHRERGMTSAALGVDAENPSGALGLYEGVGFDVNYRATSWRKAFE